MKLSGERGRIKAILAINTDMQKKMSTKDQELGKLRQIVEELGGNSGSGHKYKTLRDKRHAKYIGAWWYSSGCLSGEEPLYEIVPVSEPGSDMLCLSFQQTLDKGVLLKGKMVEEVEEREREDSIVFHLTKHAKNAVIGFSSEDISTGNAPRDRGHFGTLELWFEGDKLVSTLRRGKRAQLHKRATKVQENFASERIEGMSGSSGLRCPGKPFKSSVGAEAQRGEASTKWVQASELRKPISPSSFQLTGSRPDTQYTDNT